MHGELKTVGPWSYFHFPALRDAGIIHGFMTRTSDGILRDAGPRDAFIAALSASGMIVLDQEHKDVVHVITAGERPRRGDGLVLLAAGLIGVVKTADCLPVILSAPDYPACAIVHAGWRGTALKIARKAVRALAAFGVRPDAIGALIGPGIGPCCYNVGEDVVAAFREAGFSDDVFMQRDGAVFLDLRKANRHLLVGEGVRDIHDVDLCTSCRGDLFHSARRDAGRGRQINFVQVRG
ncbi:MAG: polyphenol oxidase family protein [Syntrophorhabdales bacterium]|jgi:YfiH family protein